MILENPPRNPSKENIWKYVQVDLFKWMRNLTVGLNGKINFRDNFVSFLASDVEIPAGGTVIVDNQLSAIPTERYIVRQTGNGVITDGNWTLENLEMTNEGAEDVVVSIRYFYIPLS